MCNVTPDLLILDRKAMCLLHTADYIQIMQQQQDNVSAEKVQD